VSDRYVSFGHFTDIQERVRYLRDHSDAIGAVADKLTGSGQQDALTELAALYASFAGCMSLLASQLPYKAGDRVRLIKSPKCEGGWAHCAHFLIVGAVGTVKTVELDYLMRDWSLLIEFDDETWIPEYDSPAVAGFWPEHKRGDRLPVTSKHVFGFKPSFVEKLP